jgi:hypothetical protein
MNSCRRRMLCCCNPWFCPTFVQLLSNFCPTFVQLFQIFVTLLFNQLLNGCCRSLDQILSNFCLTFVPRLSNFCLAGLNFVRLLFHFFSTFIQRLTYCAFCLNIYNRLFLGVNDCSKSNLIKSLYDVNTL